MTKDESKAPLRIVPDSYFSLTSGESWLELGTVMRFHKSNKGFFE